VLHRELDALARLRSAIDEIAHEDDAIGDGRVNGVEEIERFLEAPMQISYDDRSTHDLQIDEQDAPRLTTYSSATLRDPMIFRADASQALEPFRSRAVPKEDAEEET
jgi:hypothetical protein